jgi:hypothetical protein
MKNIHLIPTDKPSRLYEFGGRFNIQDKEQENFRNFNIYITSDEDLKSVDWALNIEENTIFKPSNDEIYDIKNSEAKYYEYCKKIILTTDQDLIKDGVQAIDDEFLEWFVKNPSCESVEIERIIIVDTIPRKSLYDYKIIIPQEEPKPHSFCETPEEKCTMNYCDENGCQNRKRQLTDLEIAIRLEEIEREEPKQETLEEEAENSALKHFLFPKELFFKMCKCSQNDYLLEEEFGLDNTTKYREILGFIEGAKWQAERMYSEENSNHLEWIYNRLIGFHNENPNYDYMIKLKTIIDQFKKK